MAQRTRGEASPGGHLRHPAEQPVYVLMVILNVLIIVVILWFARFLPFLPARLKDSGWGIAIRSAVLALLLLVPGLIIGREVQRASTRGTAVQLSPSQYTDLYDTATDFATRLRLRRRPQIYLATATVR